MDLVGRNEVRPLRGSIKETGVEEVVFLHGIVDKATIERWHARLGHLNQDAISKLQKMSTGMVLDTKTRQHTVNEECKGCLQGFQHVQISHILLRTSSNRLDIVWTDVKGPLLDKAIYGFSYYITFTDDMTRFSWVFPLMKKKKMRFLQLFDCLRLWQSGKQG